MPPGRMDGDRVVLTVALLTADFSAPRWIVEALEPLQSSGTVRVRVLVAGRGEPRGLETLFSACQAAVERVFGGRRKAFARVDARRVFPQASVARLGPGGRTLNVDLALHCPGTDPRLSGITGRRGTLAVLFDGVPSEHALFRALVRGERDFQLAALLRTGPKTVTLAWGRPELPERPLLLEARVNVLGCATRVLRRALEDLFARADMPARRPRPAVPKAPLSARDLARYVGDRVASACAHRLTSPAAESEQEPTWFLAYRTDAQRFVRHTGAFDPAGFKLVLPPRKRMYADPCVFRHGGEDHVFLEEWREEIGRGVISWMKPGEWTTPPKPVLERDHHLSYPFVFADRGEVFMIPESAQTRSVALYRAVRFPYCWEQEEVLLRDANAVDATVMELEGRWWMFVNLAAEGGSTRDSLHVYYAERPSGPWMPHRRNPVKIDAAATRPAGRLFRRGLALLRPAQDCRAVYGGAIRLCQILELTTTSFREVPVQRLSPGWLSGNTGLHTLTSSADLEMIDGRMSRACVDRLAGLGTAGEGEMPGRAAVSPAAVRRAASRVAAAARG